MELELTNFKYEIDERGVCLLTNNRPEVLNALNTQSWVDLENFFSWAHENPDIKVVIITGAGEKSFAAGADLKALKERTCVNGLEGKPSRALDKIGYCSKPVIAAVNGYAMGGGCELAIACDFRICSENALFALPETGLGIIPGGGGTQRLAKLIGIGRAKDVILLGRKIGGEEAVQIGLATKCVPQDQLIAEAYKVADKLLAKGPVAIAVAKRLVEMSVSTNQEVGSLVEMLGLSLLLGTEDKTEGCDSFIEKRAPIYKGK